MHFLGLAVDFDGTIARDGVVDVATRDALAAVRASGRRLIMVTGREQHDLVACFPEYAMFDRIVLENGAVLLDPATGQLRMLAPPPDPALVDHLHRLGIANMSVGLSVIAAWEPDQVRILDAIRLSGLELQITFNKGAVMVLPTGVNKGSGLLAAAADLAIVPPSIVGVGDGENDHSFLRICGCSAAVANAVASLRSEVDIVLAGDHGDGVVALLADLQRLDADLLPEGRRGIDAGLDRNGKPVRISATSRNILILGPSMSGKSTFATMLIEQVIGAGLGLAILDPEGDYVALAGTTILDADGLDKSLHSFGLLLAARLNPVLALRGIDPARRRQFMRAALDLSVTTAEASGTPSYLVIDEAHQGLSMPLDKPLVDHPRLVLLTLSADLLAADTLASIGTVCALGPNADFLLSHFCHLTGHVPPLAGEIPEAGEMLLWNIPHQPVVLRPGAPDQQHVRHAGKYATGDVGRERSFYFRGAHNTQLLPARNLYEFLEVGREVDDAVWSHHLYNGDFERWFASVIRDPALADLARRLRHAPAAPASATWAALQTSIMSRYCLPAGEAKGSA